MAHDDMISQMREDRPLDVFFPELTAPQAPNTPTEVASTSAPAPLVHPGVLEVEVEGGWTWAMACWRPPEEGEDLAASLTALLTHTVLQEWSRPPGYGGPERVFLGAHVFAFSPVMASTLEQLGFTKVTYVPEQYASRMLTFQNEAERGGWEAPQQPVSLWWAPFHRPDATLDAALTQVHEEMVDALGSKLWGMSPGSPSKLMAELLGRRVQVTVTPDLEGLHALDMVLVDRTPGALRWMPPMVFQALADFVGVVLTASEGKRVQWGVCEVRGDGLFHPPLFRLQTVKGPVELEVGLELMRVCLMPIEGQGPLLRDWVRNL